MIVLLMFSEISKFTTPFFSDQTFTGLSVQSSELSSGCLEIQKGKKKCPACEARLTMYSIFIFFPLENIQPSSSLTHKVLGQMHICFHFVGDVL